MADNEVNQRLEKLADQMTINHTQINVNLKRLLELQKTDGEDTRENWIFGGIGLVVGVLVEC